jgi:outer membrane translocation and assembly module TamA
MLDAELIHRYATFARGDPYTLDQLLEFQQALYDTQCFQTVEISPGAA